MTRPPRFIRLYPLGEEGDNAPYALLATAPTVALEEAFNLEVTKTEATLAESGLEGPALQRAEVRMKLLALAAFYVEDWGGDLTQIHPRWKSPSWPNEETHKGIWFEERKRTASAYLDTGILMQISSGSWATRGLSKEEEKNSDGPSASPSET